MIVPRDAFDALGEAIDRQGEAAARAVARLSTGALTGDLSEIIDYIVAVVDLYGDAAATVAADFYEELAEAAGITVLTARLAEASETVVRARARAKAEDLAKRGATASEASSALGELARTMVRRSANSTVLENAVRDADLGAKFARVPSGPDACAFCVMLASRGFVYASRKSAGEGSPPHARGTRKRRVHQARH